MTLTELKSLTGSQLRILVAEAEGWTQVHAAATGDILGCKSPLRGWLNVPKYDTSRDAITEAILRRFTTDAEKSRFGAKLLLILPGVGSAFTIATASAEDLCRAFLAALKGEK